MHFEGVLVSFKVEGNEETHETSGILFNKNFVILTGTSLIPLLPQEKWISALVKSTSSNLESNKYIENVFFRVFFEIEEGNENKKVSKKVNFLEGKAVGAWKCPLITETLKKLFYDWTLGHIKFENELETLSSDHIDLSKELMSMFVLLKCDGREELKLTNEKNKSDDDIRVLFNCMSSLEKPSRGQEVEVVSTPFGNEHFINSLSRGVVSNVVGCKNCIILSDARTVSGCEGGPIYVAQRSRTQDQKPKLIGIVSCPLTWWRGEWVGLTIGISLMPVFKRLLRIDETIGCEECFENAFSTSGSDLLRVNFIDETVVFIRSKTSWGSGVILNAASGVIITCSHVVKEVSEHMLQTLHKDDVVSVFQKGNRFSAIVVFKSRNDVAYDLAILKAKNNFEFKNEAIFSDNFAKIGDLVVAAGFPFFSEKDDLCIQPSIATGCIARVNPYMIQTTCCIQSGFSGGALFRNGELLGIIISNAKDSTAGALFPHINFIIPSAVFREPVLKYIKTNDVQNLKDLECSNIKVQELWKLQISKL